MVATIAFADYQNDTWRSIAATIYLCLVGCSDKSRYLFCSQLVASYAECQTIYRKIHIAMPRQCEQMLYLANSLCCHQLVTSLLIAPTHSCGNDS